MLFFLVILSSPILAQTNLIWSLKDGREIQGDYYTSGTQAIVLRTAGTNLILNVAELSTNSFIQYLKCKYEARERQMAYEAGQLKATGQIEFTVKMFEDFPEKAQNQKGWMDAVYEGTDDTFLLAGDKDYLVGFCLKDNEGDRYCKCAVFKINPNDNTPAPDLAKIMALKKGDYVRFYGVPQDRGDYNELWFVAANAQLIQSATDRGAIEESQFKIP